jgi:hypothetical protein
MVGSRFPYSFRVGRKKQCNHRWKEVLDPKFGRAIGRSGKWTVDEDNQLKDAVQMHGDQDWVAISALVLGRTKKQCCDKWKKGMDPNRTTFRRKEHGTLKKAPTLGQDPHSP